MNFPKSFYHSQPLPEMRIIRFVASTDAEANNSYYEDIGAAGTYLISVPTHMDDTTAATCAFGAFHSNVSIKYLDDFEYEMFDAISNERLFED